MVRSREKTNREDERNLGQESRHDGEEGEEGQQEQREDHSRPFCLQDTQHSLASKVRVWYAPP